MSRRAYADGEAIVSLGGPCCCKHPFREKLAEKEAERCGSGGDASTCVGVNTVTRCSFKVLKKKPFWLKPFVFFSLTSSFSNGLGIDRLIRQKKLAETQKLETMYSTLFEKFNNEETVFEEKLECDFNQLNKQTHLLPTSGSVDFECSSPSFLLRFCLWILPGQVLAGAGGCGASHCRRSSCLHWRPGARRRGESLLVVGVVL